MSNEPILEDVPTEDATQPSEPWEMPEPIFRTTEGHAPKSVTRVVDADEVDTESPESNSVDEVDTETPDTDLADVEAQSEASDEIEPEDGNDASEIKAKPNRGCAKSFLFIVGLIGFLAVAVILAVVYFLFYFRPAETGTF